jgi:hypothetical protein
MMGKDVVHIGCEGFLHVVHVHVEIVLNGLGSSGTRGSKAAMREGLGRGNGYILWKLMKLAARRKRRQRGENLGKHLVPFVYTSYSFIPFHTQINIHIMNKVYLCV